MTISYHRLGGLLMSDMVNNFQKYPTIAINTFTHKIQKIILKYLLCSVFLVEIVINLH